MKIDEEYRAASNSIFEIVTEHHQADTAARQEKREKMCAHKFVAAVYSLVMAPKFNHFITFVILINTLVMAMEYSTPETNYYTPKAYTAFLEDANTVCSIIFLVEMILKLVGMGWGEYSKDAFNIFDMVIVDVSISEWVYAAFADTEVGAGFWCSSSLSRAPYSSSQKAGRSSII